LICDTDIFYKGENYIAGNPIISDVADEFAETALLFFIDPMDLENGSTVISNGLYTFTLEIQTADNLTFSESVSTNFQY